ncbi:MAG: hypothetical protein QOH90_1839 [Actinomycetota bacterium]|nr:hypothetical protein [Actinomycetota bacterium]
MTGEYAHNHGVQNNDETSGFDQNATIQRYLHDNGYRTGLFGKFLNSWHGDLLYFDDWAMNNGSHRYYDGRWIVNGTPEVIEEYSTDYLDNVSQTFLQDSESQDERPWYLYLSVLAPHTPFTAETDYENAPVPRWKPDRGVLEVSRKDKPGYVRHSHADINAAYAVRKKQLRTLMSVDDLVDDVMNQLEALGEADNTLAFFLSDNGYLLGDHGMLGPVASKGNPYTASIKVPMYMRWPGEIRQGAVDNRQVTNVDLAPTILDAAGITPDPEYPLDGRTLFDPWQRERVLTEYRHTPKTRTPSWASLRTPRYQYIETYDWQPIGTSDEVYGDAGDQVISFHEYYDLKKDPWQNHNILDDKTRKNDPDVGRLHRMLDHDRHCRGADCP